MTPDVAKSGDGILAPQRFILDQVAIGQIALNPGEKKMDQIAKTHAPNLASLFISDMHLGARACRDEALLRFLQDHQADRIFLVGDIFDTWHGIGAHWSLAQHDIIALLLARAAAGTHIIYTPGNHDAFFRQYIGAKLGNITVANHVIHTSSDGKRYLVIHGDSVDIFAGRYPLVSRLAAKAENSLRGLGNAAQRLLRRFDLPISDQVDWLILQVNNMIRAQDDFQARLAALARKHGADGIICGHFHQPALHDEFGVTYANCGDWVENATALAEGADGRLMLLQGVISSRSIARAAAPQTMIEDF